MRKQRRDKPLETRASIKSATSFKLSTTALGILAELAIKRGIAKSAVIENLLRDEAKRSN